MCTSFTGFLASAVTERLIKENIVKNCEPILWTDSRVTEQSLLHVLLALTLYSTFVFLSQVRGVSNNKQERFSTSTRENVSQTGSNTATVTMNRQQEVAYRLGNVDW